MAEIKTRDLNEVPEKIKDAALLVCKRFCITGVCDPMYICNTIAYETNTGNGEGFFDEKPNISHEGWEKAAKYIQFAYGRLIMSVETDELVSIMENKQIDTKLALERLKSAYERYETEMESCKTTNPYHIPYLEKLLQNINSTIVNFTVETNKKEAEEKRNAFKNEFQPKLESCGIDKFLEDTTWFFSDGTGICPAIKKEVFDTMVLPLVKKYYPTWISNESCGSCLLIEYWADKDMCKYLLDAGYDCKDISYEIQSEKLNAKVKELALAERSNA